ncbi:MAG: prepilin-type N-terminal cleavage/methylation domain-containing protein, partial [Acidobacteriota bacterium]
VGQVGRVGRVGYGLEREGGFSLPELLVSLSITLVVTAAALTALQDANRTTQAATVMSDVNQNLRVGMNLLIRDLLLAGSRVPTGGIPVPSGEGALPILRPGPTGSTLTFPPEWTTLPAVSPGPALGQVINGVQTDVVTILYVDVRLDLGTAAAIAEDGSSITLPDTVAVDDPAAGIREGDLIMITNGLGNALQEVTAVEGQQLIFAATAESGLNQREAPQGSVLQLRNPDGTWPAGGVTATRIQMVSYYLEVPSSGPVTAPHLIRRMNYGEARAIAVGIENVQLTWDLVDGVTNPTNIDTPEPPQSPHQIRKANVYMAARAIQQYSGLDQVLRGSLTTQVSLRNMAFVDRYR